PQQRPARAGGEARVQPAQRVVHAVIDVLLERDLSPLQLLEGLAALGTEPVGAPPPRRIERHGRLPYWKGGVEGSGSRQIESRPRRRRGSRKNPRLPIDFTQRLRSLTER